MWWQKSDSFEQKAKRPFIVCSPLTNMSCCRAKFLPTAWSSTNLRWLLFSRCCWFTIMSSMLVPHCIGIFSGWHTLVGVEKVKVCKLLVKRRLLHALRSEICNTGVGGLFLTLSILAHSTPRTIEVVIISHNPIVIERWNSNTLCNYLHLPSFCCTRGTQWPLYYIAPFPDIHGRHTCSVHYRTYHHIDCRRRGETRAYHSCSRYSVFQHERTLPCVWSPINWRHQPLSCVLFRVELVFPQG